MDTAPTKTNTYRHTLALHDALPINSIAYAYSTNRPTASNAWPSLSKVASCRNSPSRSQRRRIRPSKTTSAKPEYNAPATKNGGKMVECQPAIAPCDRSTATMLRSEEHTSELQSLMRISSAVIHQKNKKGREHTHRH